MRAGVVAGSLAWALASAAAATPPPEALKAEAAAVRDKALAGGSPAYGIVDSLTTEVGPRLAGTEAARRATDWALAKLTALGFRNVHAEAFPIRAWVRGPESGELVAPYPFKLSLATLGGSVATPPDGVEAELAVFPTYAALLAAPAGSLTGKIAVVTQPMARRQDGAGYGYNNPIRRQGPSEAARRGAIAYLHRSLATSDVRLPHAGALNYQADAPKIPAAALAVADAELIDRLAARGVRMRVKLALRPAEQAAEAWNVVGDIPGRERPSEVVLLGAHLDSWDLGQGAVDDGAGVGIAAGVAKLVAETGRGPSRTLRVVLFGAEEMDNSGPAFAAAHQADAASFVVANEADFGAERALQVLLPAGAADAPFGRAVAELLAPLQVILSRDPALRAGDDLARLRETPFFAVRQDGARYFDLHHSADDTLDKIDRRNLDHAVAAWAAVVFLVANSDVNFRAMAPRAPAQP